MTVAGETRVAPERLVRFAAGVCRAIGMPQADADLLADSLVMADLWGISPTA